MFKTSEVLYSILLISICVLILVYYKKSLYNIRDKIMSVFSITEGKPKTKNKPVVESESELFRSSKVSNSALFNTEYEVTENADCAISDALKDIE